MNLKNYFYILSELTKIRITIFVMITTSFGFIAASGSINSDIIFPTLGILLLACGSAALNHYQERKTDDLMLRTKNRPIPSGRITAIKTLKISITLIIFGSVILYLGSNVVALSLGLLNLVWYNYVYTPLKKISSLAIVPGSLVGAIPPAVGWVAGGGNLLNPQIILISFFFFIWQIPHFWLLLMNYSDDYRRAGFPTLTSIFDSLQLARITFVWILATGITGLLLPLFGISENLFVNLSLFIAALALAYNSLSLLNKHDEAYSLKFAFRSIKYLARFIVIIVSVHILLIS